MHRACQQTCEMCDASPPEPPLDPDIRRSLPLGTTQQSWCGNSDDESRIRDRGFFVWRRAVPVEELRAMQRQVESMPNGLSKLCGVPYDQAPECVLHAAQLRATYPLTHAAIRAKMADWVRSGFHRRAGLGWPLEVMGAEFIAINRWTPRLNSSCHLSALFRASAARRAACLERMAHGEVPAGNAGGQALHADDSLAAGWQRCAYDALAHGMELAEARHISEALEEGGKCPAITHEILHGPTDYIQGDSGDVDFGNGHGVKRLRILSSLRAWLSRAHNSTPAFYNGYHDWHVDGPGAYGREHKAYVLVSKGALSSSGSGGGGGSGGGSLSPLSEASPQSNAAPRDLSNLRVVPSHAQVWKKASGGRSQSRPHWQAPVVESCAAEFCEELPSADADGDTDSGGGSGGGGDGGGPACAAQKGAGFFGELWSEAREQPGAEVHARTFRAWGVPDDWAAIDRLGCDVALDPGDILFWREDVWHRTQDAVLDRMALRIDIQRLPFEPGHELHDRGPEDRHYGS